MKKKILFAVVVTLLFSISCSHRKSEVGPVPLPDFEGPRRPTGESVFQGGSKPAPQPPPAGAPPATSQPSICPADGSYLVVDPYLDGEEKKLGRLTARTIPQLGEDKGHAGGRIDDFAVYTKNREDFLLVNYGRTLVKRNSSQTILAQTSLSHPIKKFLFVTHDSKDWVVAGTAVGLHFYEVKDREFVPGLTIPFPDEITLLYLDERKRDLYVATTQNNIYRLPLAYLEGGCVDLVVRREAFLDRTVKKMEVQGDRLFIFSEKQVNFSEEEFWIERLQPVVEAMWDAEFARVDAIDLKTGTKKKVSTMGHAPIHDFFVHQNKLYLVVNPILNNVEREMLEKNLKKLLMEECGRNDLHCPSGKKALLEASGSVVPGRESFWEYRRYPAGLLVYPDLEQLDAPGLVYKIRAPQDMAGDRNRVLAWNRFLNPKAVAKDNRIYFSGETAILLLKIKPNGGLEQIDSDPHYEVLLGGTLKIGLVTEGNEQILLRLRERTLRRALEKIVLSTSAITEYSSRALPRIILGNKGETFFTSEDLARVDNLILARWEAGMNFGTRIAYPSGWDSSRDFFGFDSVSGNFTFVWLDEGSNRVDPVDDIYKIEVLEGSATFNYQLPRISSFSVGPNCRGAFDAQVQGVRSVSVPNSQKASHFLLVFREFRLVGSGCPDQSPPDPVLGVAAFENDGPAVSGDDFIELTPVKRAVWNPADAQFALPPRKTQNNDAAYLSVVFQDRLFLVKRFENRQAPNDYQKLGASLLTAPSWSLVPEHFRLLVSRGEADSFIVAKKKNQGVQFYQFSWLESVEPMNHFDVTIPLLVLDADHEIVYDAPMASLNGELESINFVDGNRWLLRLLDPAGGSRLELMGVEGNRFKRLGTEDVSELLGVYFNFSWGRLVLTTADDGIVFREAL